MEREKDVEAWLRHAIQAAGGQCWKFTSPGRAGVPDRIILMPRGRVVFVELKTETGELSRIQQHELDQLRNLGHEACVVYGQEAAEDFYYDLRKGVRLQDVYEGNDG